MAHAQVPEIYSISPPAARAGEVVRIIGDQFATEPANNTVHIGASKARVLRSWVSELEVEVPPSLQAGPVTVSVGNKLAISSTPFLPLFAPFGATNPVYAQRVKFSGGFNPAAVDLDNDGDLELIVAKSEHLEVYRYVGTEPLLSENSFALVQSVTGFVGTASIREMDMDANGKFDLLVTSSNGVVRIARNWYQSGEPGKDLLAVYTAPTPQSRVSEFFDVNLDGTPDLISWDGSNVYYYRGISSFGGGHGTHASGQRIAPIDGRLVTGMAVGDLNLDGHVDVATLDGQKITIHSHNSRSSDVGTDWARFTLSATNLTGLQIADLQGDGQMDLIAFNRATRYCEAYWNRNHGGHLAAEDFEHVVLSPPEISSTILPRLIDLDGDALPELIFRSRSYHHNESALLGDLIFGGTFLPFTNAWNVSFTSTAGLLSADLNRDGQPEIITSDGTIYQNLSAVAPVIIASEQWRSGSMQISVAGYPNQTVSLRSTTDFISWTNAGSIRVGESGVAKLDMAATTPMRFYVIAPEP